MAQYTVEMRDDACSETRNIEADTLDEATKEAESETRDWIEGGDWGQDGASISARWTLCDEDGDEVDTGSVTVEIEPDHESLIKAVCDHDQWERCCGGDPDDHDWTSKGEGGLNENPGVWSTGGTSMSFASHCRKCGLHRSEHHTGSQRNPGEHDTVSYEMPETWCADCHREECECDHAGSYKIKDTGSGAAVIRSNGDWAEFEGTTEARRAMRRLAADADREDDYEWTADE